MSFLLGDDTDLNMSRFLQFFIALTACITAMMLFYSEKSYASLRCFSFIPYGIKNSFVTLPYEKEFCFKYSGEYTYMRTNKLGGRLIPSPNRTMDAVAFGESQLLGLDSSDDSKPFQHDLKTMLPNYNFTIYAAPNNGPFEVLSQIEQLGPKMNLEQKLVVLGFNYSTDIFRIRSSWDPKKFVPVGEKNLERIFFIPGFHDLVLFYARLKGVKFGSTVSNSLQVRQYYLAMTDREREMNTEIWLSNLSENHVMKASSRILVLFPPYWSIDAVAEQKNKIKRDYQSFACTVFERGIFDKIIYSELPENQNVLADDNRHFLTGALVFKHYTC